MALSTTDVTELLDAIRAGDGIDPIRRGLELVLQALIEAEATEVVGAERHERTETRTNQRNGARPGLLSTKAGDVELRIPKLRRGSFFPSVLERRRRIDRALWAVVMEAYVHGVSTRKVDDLVAALGLDAGISKSEVSRICKELDTEMAAFRDRPLGHVEFPYVFADATYVKARVGGRVVSKAIVIATGVTRDGDREVLGLAVGDSEDGAFWTAFLRSLRARGLSGVQLVISDAHEGLKAAIAAVFADASWQRCRVHFMRNVLARVPKGSSEMVAAAIRTIFAQPDASHVHAQLTEIASMLGRQFPAVAEMLEDARENLLAFSAFPPAHWRQIWSTNPLDEAQPRAQAAHRRGGHLPQRGGGSQVGHRRDRRAPGRVGRHRPALTVGVVDGEDLRAEPDWSQGGERRPYNQAAKATLSITGKASSYTTPRGVTLEIEPKFYDRSDDGTATPTPGQLPFHGTLRRRRGNKMLVFDDLD